MQLVEIRDLDGPNIFLREPAVKIEFELQRGDRDPAAVAALEARFEPLGLSDEERPGGDAAIGHILMEAVEALHERAGQPEPETTWAEIETPDHLAVAFGWRRRQFALALAGLLADIATGEAVDIPRATAKLPALVSGDDPDDRPHVVRDADRRIPIVAVTGTNGKTTTTRLIAHVLRSTGRRVGWTTTVGVYVEGELVIEGDYTGPSGAWRVLEEENLDAAVLETARGGILLRGLAYESNDVSVMTNVSGDHLGLHGIHTVEGLAEVKAAVIRVTRPSGTVVLNADDERVRGLASSVHAPICWISQDAEHPMVVSHLAAGGRALFIREDMIVVARGDKEETVVAVADVPITFRGRARHMIENTLCATAACFGLGLKREEIAAALTTFGRDAEDNPGRLHVYQVRGATVILDYAHNEIGLRHLLDLARGYRDDNGCLTAIIGTAGDRTDEALREIGRIAGTGSDRVLIKETERYLRGRASTEEMNTQFLAGVADGGAPPHEIVSDEIAALDVALRDLKPGDVVAMMCIEEGPAARERVEAASRE